MNSRRIEVGGTSSGWIATKREAQQLQPMIAEAR